MKISLAQLNPMIGDLQGNTEKLRETLLYCRTLKPDLVIFPELFITGYPPKDLLERRWFVERTEKFFHEIIEHSHSFPQTGILLGAPMNTGKETGKSLYNAAILIHKGKLIFYQPKSLLPTYDVFDETRYFEPAQSVATFPFAGERLGISICEDAWNHPDFWPTGTLYRYDPIDQLAKQGATIFINISASPFTMGKEEQRYRILSDHARRHGIPFLYLNQVGGNDELVFDGRSLVVDSKGDPLAVFPSFREHVETIDTTSPTQIELYSPEDPLETVHQALILGVRDYVRKCGFSQVTIGLSGGIDSAVVCVLACDALGPQNVHGIAMPSPFSSPGSVKDAKLLAQNLGIPFHVIPIDDIFSSYLNTLNAAFSGRDSDVTEENIQARIRGNILMAFSNKFGYLVLTTGNKSEIAVGYCTLYGDMSGGLSVLSDVPKTLVYRLANHINKDRPVIPLPIIKKPPSAELRPNQTDQDTLPPYPVLDQILTLYIEEMLPPQAIVKKGFEKETVEWVAKAVESSEYKRKQAPPGLKVTSKAFGIGRRMPIAAKCPLN